MVGLKTERFQTPRLFVGFELLGFNYRYVSIITSKKSLIGSKLKSVNSALAEFFRFLFFRFKSFSFK